MNNASFCVGPIATDERFIGRHKEIEELSTVFRGLGSIHLVGATRIGKSSLIYQVFQRNESTEGAIPIQLDLSVYENAFQFWASLCEEIAGSVFDLEIALPSGERHIQALSSMDSDDPNWYGKMRRPLTRVLEELKKVGYKVVLSIDEFDAVTRVFEGNAAYYQMLRSLFSESRYALNGIIVTRKNLEVLEAKAQDVSTFHGVFDTIRLRSFTDAEMGEYFERLKAFGVSVDDEMSQQLQYYTGGIPYLCCMLGNELIAQCGQESSGSDVAVVTAYKACIHEIHRYYNDLINRLEEDGHLDPLVWLAFDEMRTLSYSHNRDNMIAMGYLNEEVSDGVPTYYAYCHDFMRYLRTRPLDGPTWEMLSSTEKKLKQIFSAVYPRFKEVTYADVHGRNADEVKRGLEQAHPETGFVWKSETDKFLKSSRSYIENPSVLDTLAVTFIISRITYDSSWDRSFAAFFDYDSSWKAKLDLIAKVRNPVAHSHEDHIPED